MYSHGPLSDHPKCCLFLDRETGKPFFFAYVLDEFQVGTREMDELEHTPVELKLLQAAVCKVLWS